jgi:tetratricopeptide (TPR) repeat protein
MRLIKVFISGIQDDLRREQEVVERTIRSLRIDGARIDMKYSDERLPLDSVNALVYESDIFIGLYDRTHYGWKSHSADVSFAESEFDQARRLEKSKLVFVKRLQDTELADRQESAFIERILQEGDKDLRTFEFNSLAQLEEILTDSFTALISEQLDLKVTRPIFQAPSPLDTFVGREAPIAKLIEVLTRGQVVVIRGVSDSGGMGKSELATRVAHLLRDKFSDGVLWANIQTTRPADLLTTWARAFGGFPSLGRGDLRFEFRAATSEERRIEEIAIRAEETRRVLSGKRVLAILDGVEDEQDDIKVSPLLSALTDCTVIITSRTRRLRLPHTAISIDLDRMTQAESWKLFERIVGTHRLENESSSVAEIGAIVGFMPLALDLLAARLRERQSMTPKVLLGLLRSEREQLESSKWGYQSLRGMQSAVNTVSRFLSEDDKNFFSSLGAFAGDDFDAAAAASVAQTTTHVAERTLEQLSSLSYVQTRFRPERYRLHPVLRAFARDQMIDRNAELRMAKYYGGLAKEYGRKLQGAEIHDAHAVLNLELSNIFAAHAYAQERNDRTNWELRRDFIHGAMTFYFNLHAMWSDWISWSRTGIEACQKLGDASSGVSIASSLGLVYQRKGDWDQAIEFYDDALDLMERLGNTQGAATVSMNLGVVQTQMGEWPKAISSLGRSLQLFESIGDKRGMAQVRANLGMLYSKHGERNKARAYWSQALEMFDALGSKNEGDIVRKWLKGQPREN